MSSQSASSANRRQFLGQLGGAAAAGYFVAHGSPAAASRSANQKLQIGAIGVGGRGAADLAAVAGESIVALCDVDSDRLKSAAQKHPGAKTYQDYRELLELPNLDAVVVATPDHHHAPAAARAIRRGLHVYCEKPLTHTVAEARLLNQLSQKHKVVTQMGTQNHQHPGYLRLVELLQSKAIGDVSEVHIITDRPGRFWQQGLPRPQQKMPVPGNLDWNLWLGPAAERPYHEAFVPFRWRGWWDFGCGAIGDMAIHLMDPTFWALELAGAPVAVTAFGPRPLPDCGPTWMAARFDYQQRKQLPPCSVFWYEGVAQANSEIAAELPMNGSLFVGTEGKIAIAHGGMPKLLPEATFKDFQPPQPYLPPSPGHHQQWINACKGDGETGSNFQYAGPFTEVVLLGNVAYRLGETVHYDPATGKASSDAANALLSKSYRKGWEVAES